MANNDLLKEAIADAKAVKETAIANAKLALEEAFTPQLKSMFAAKLQEMEEDDIKEMWYSDDSEWEHPSTGFTIFSAPEKLDDLQNHILTFAATLDEKLIVCNQAYNLPISKCSVRYVVLDGQEICEFKASAKIDLPKKHTEETDRMIDFVREEVKQEAFKKMMKKVSWVKK